MAAEQHAHDARRVDTLRSFGAQGDQIEELLAYNRNLFASSPANTPVFPLPDEPFVEVWQEYVNAGKNFYQQLCRDFPQLNFPIKSGISQDPDYLKATRKGEWESNCTALPLNNPEGLELSIHASLAGRIPVIVAADRSDFEILLRALSRRNEPATIPPAMGACMIAGLNNWGRVRRYREQWEKKQNGSPADWASEMSKLASRRELYQDRLILLNDCPYSGVPATAMGMGEKDWKSASLIIRREHECAHYFTRRVLNSMRNNILDELIADYCGIVACRGVFDSSWFLRFVGLEEFPRYRMGARLENYRGDPPLSDGSFRTLQALVLHAANNLAVFSRSLGPETGVTPQLLLTLTTVTLEDLAQEDAPVKLQETWRKLMESQIN